MVCKLFDIVSHHIQQLTMIKSICRKQSMARLIMANFTRRNYYSYTGAVKILRDSDIITQSDIDSILGNQPSKKDIQKAKQQEQLAANKELFYGLLPTKNQHFPVCIDPDQPYILQTPNQNIMAALNITVQSSYYDYCKSIQNLWKEDQLYGSTTAPTKILAENLEFNQLLTADSKYLVRLRGQFLVNLSVPGSIQAQDPRNFLQMRPVQQFRNTPLIPIAESAMKKHKEKLQDYHRRQFVFQVKKESIFNFMLFATAAGICGYMIYLILQKQEERTVAYTRMKYNRRMGIQETPTFKI